MLKKIKKATSMLLTLVLTFLVFAPTSVHAVIPGEDSLPGSQDVIFSIRGKDISDSLVQTLASYNIETEDNTLLEVIPSGLGNNSTALMITSQDGSSLTKSVIFALDDEGAPQAVSMNSIVPNADPITVGETEDLFTNGSFLGVWAIQYDYNIVQIFPCSRPRYAQIIFYNSGGHNFQSFSMKYVTEGRLYSYPEGENKGEKTHTISLSSTSPVANRYYANSSNALASNRRIAIEVEGGHSVILNFKVNSRNYTWHHVLPIL